MNSEGTSVNIDANKVIERLAQRIADLEITVAQQTAVIAALIAEKEETA
jgi:uncharacterized coiled-coil protein SlyX